MERQEIIQSVQASGLSIRRACRAAGISRSTYYRWRCPASRMDRGPAWNALREEDRKHILAVSESRPEWSSRQIAFHVTDSGSFSVSESTVYRVLKAAGKIPLHPGEPQRASGEYIDKPERVHDQWQIDFTDFFLPSWGWYHDGGVLDDKSRFMLHHDLRPYEKACDAIDIIDDAVSFAVGTHGYAARRVVSDHGKCFESADTKSYLHFRNIRPIYARSHHPQTVGKLERLHRTMKETVNLHVYESPEELQRAIDQFYYFYNYDRYHESLGNVTPSDVYYGKVEAVLERRRQIKLRTLIERRTRYETWKQRKDLTLAALGGT